MHWGGTAYESVPGVGRLLAVAKFGVRVRAFCYYTCSAASSRCIDPMTRILIGTVGPSDFTARLHPEPGQLFPRTR